MGDAIPAEARDTVISKIPQKDLEELTNILNEKGFFATVNQTKLFMNFYDFSDTALNRGDVTLNGYSLYLPTELIERVKDRDKLLQYLLATRYRLIGECCKFNPQFNFIFNIITDDINMKTNVRLIETKIEQYFGYRYEDNFKGNLFLDIQTLDEYSLKVRALTLSLKDEFLVKHNFYNNFNHYIPACMVLKQENFNVPENYTSINYADNAKNILDTLRRRYKMTSDNVIYTNEITDKSKVYSIMDKNILRNINNYNFNNNVPYNDKLVILNPNLSYFSEGLVREIPIPHLLALFDIQEKEMLSICKKVSYLTNTIVALGIGGLMSNFLYWCYQFKEYFRLDYMFKQLIVFEPDELEFSNLFRIPLNWKDRKTRMCVTNEKLRALLASYRYGEISDEPDTFKKINLIDGIRSISPKLRSYDMRFQRINLKNCIFIGGPDLDTRDELYNYYIAGEANKYQNASFLCTTHSNNTFSIDAFPKFDRELVVETYGSIDLNKFLLNMFKMTIEILKILANKEFEGKVNHKFMDYSIDNEDFIANSKKHKCLKDIVYAIN